MQKATPVHDGKDAPCAGTPGAAHGTGPIEIIDVVPPHPSKLADIFELLRDDETTVFPSVEATFTLIDLCEIAPRSGTVMFPCRASDLHLDGQRIMFLDEAPDLKEEMGNKEDDAFVDFTLVGCTLSLKIFKEIYGFQPPFVNMCPKEWAKLNPAGDPSARRLIRCCRVKNGFEKMGSKANGLTAAVPWGVSKDEFLAAVAWLTSDLRASDQ